MPDTDALAIQIAAIADTLVELRAEVKELHERLYVGNGSSIVGRLDGISYRVDALEKAQARSLSRRWALATLALSGIAALVSNLTFALLS